MKLSEKNLWLPYCKEDRGAQVRLFCLPYAGGAASMFRNWSPALLPEIEVCAIELPGRSLRIREKPVSHLLPLALSVCEGILPYLDRPFAIYGHSMGALIGFEMCRHLQGRLGQKPLVFFAAGRDAAHVPEPHSVHHLPDEELVQRMRELSPTLTGVLDHPEFRKLMMPTLRADFAVSETYIFAGGPSLECPIVALNGMTDSETTVAGMEAWSTHTRAGFKLKTFPGDHFFPNTAQAMVLQTIAEEITLARIRPAGAEIKAGTS